MATITLKVSEADKTFMQAMAKFEGVSLQPMTLEEMAKELEIDL